MSLGNVVAQVANLWRASLAIYFFGLLWLVLYGGLVFASLIFDRPDELP